MEEIYPFNEHNKTIFYTTTFMIYTIITCYFMASLGVNSILIRDITILGKWFSDRKKNVNTLHSDVIIACHAICPWKM